VPGSEGSSFLPVGNHKTISENIKWWLEEALTALGVQRALFVTVSLGALLALPTIVGSKRIVVDGYVAHELVTRLADARIWWRLLYRINRLLYDARVGFLSLMMLVAIRFLLARVFRLRFAQALLRTPVRAFPKIGDALSREPTDHLAVQASIAVPTLVVLGSRGTWWLIGQRSVRKVVEQMSSAVRDTLLGAEHFLRKPDQEELAKRIVRFAREHGILPPE
jgi:pimeloyl-ACP methyl ester carboxylesterase